MLTTIAGKINNKNKSLKKFLKKSNVYYFLRDFVFLNEQMKEKRIEKKKGLDGMIKYCKEWYKKSTGLELNLENPQTLTDKMQWIKFNDFSPIKTEMTDKLKVREHIKRILGEEFLVPLLSIDGKDHFENAFDIDFNKLPNSFVLSCNHGSSMTIVISDKKKLSNSKIRSIKKKLNRWLKINLCYTNAFDFIYRDIKPCILIFKMLMDSNGELNDYKFTCFNGKVNYFWVDSDRFSEHKRNVYDTEYNDAPFTINHYKKGNPRKANNLQEMKEIAEKLSKDFKMVRVDLYDVDGKIYFGEMTFNSEAGKALPEPISYNAILGNCLEL